MCPSVIQIGSKTAEKNSAQTNRQTDKQTDRQTDRHYENNGHLAVNQLSYGMALIFLGCREFSEISISQGTVATLFKRGWICYYRFPLNCVLNLNDDKSLRINQLSAKLRA